MGQTSLPLINRAGTFSYWDKSWDSNYQYAYYNTKFSYLDDLFYYFFQNKVFLNKFKNFKKTRKLPLKLTKGYFAKNNLNLQSKSVDTFYFCSSKLWVFKYGSWVLMSIYLYDLGLKQFKKKKFKNLELETKKNIRLFSLEDIGKYKKNKNSIALKSLKKLRTFLLNNQFKGSINTNNAKHFKDINSVRIFKNFFRKKKTKKKVFDLSYYSTKKSFKEILYFNQKFALLNNTTYKTNSVENTAYRYF